MVQIIPGRWSGVSFQKDILYIPHGSDNTYFSHRCFITRHGLYIPHGSDNTLSCLCSLLKTSNFISHMVQIIRKKFLGFKCLCVCFISHMVQIIPDNTAPSILPANFFISHMVQIILIARNTPHIIALTFISHMVQIIQVVAQLEVESGLSLYPTWFR